MTDPTDLLPESLPPEPLEIVSNWLAQAWERRDQPNPNAMVLATVAADGSPSARVVLCKQIAPHPGYVTFYTNYESRKGKELEGNPRASVVMFWDHMHRQVRIEGIVVRAPSTDSDAYFASRPWQSRIGAWASAQSQPVNSRVELQTAVADTARRFGIPVPLEDEESTTRDFVVPRPPHWGGFRLWADSVELWVAGEARIHDRARWTRKLTRQNEGLFDVGPWTTTRLQP